MERKAIKKPEYDGNACMLYDYMIYQELTEKIVMRRMGIDKEHPYLPVSRWIQDPYSIPMHRIPVFCSILNAPIEALFTKSRILNGLPFSVYGSFVKKINLSDISSDDLIEEVKHRGYKVYKEV